MSENLIVESVRKSVTQSCISLAKRFSNLKAMNKVSNFYVSLLPRRTKGILLIFCLFSLMKNAEEDEPLSFAKSKNKLVIPDEDGSRTVFVKNLSASTNPAVIQKMTGTCGSVSVSM